MPTRTFFKNHGFYTFSRQLLTHILISVPLICIHAAIAIINQLNNLMLVSNIRRRETFCHDNTRRYIRLNVDFISIVMVSMLSAPFCVHLLLAKHVKLLLVFIFVTRYLTF